jgi:biopolymer transport protein ExbD
MIRPSKHRDLPKICRIDVSAFLAVLIVLYLLNGGIPTDVDFPNALVNLVKTTHGVPREIPIDAISITLQRDGRTFFQAQQISRENLTTKIRTTLSHGVKRRAYMFVDRAVRYRELSITLLAARDAGIQDFTFIVTSANEHYVKSVTDVANF